MALGAHNEQAAGSPDFFRLYGNLRLVLFHALGIFPAGLQNPLVIGIRIAGCLGNDFFLITGFPQFLLCQILCVAAQHNIRTTACHVGCNGHCAHFAGLRHDFRLFFVVLCVQHIVRNALLFQHSRHQFALFDRNGTHQNRLSLFMALNNLIHHRPEFCGLRFVNHIGMVYSCHRLIGGNLDNIQFVNGLEFFLLGHCRTGHTGQLAVQTEVILEGNGCQRFVFPLHVHMLFCLNGLVQTLAVPTTQHNTACELVHNQHFAVFDHIVNIPFHNTVSAQRLIDMMIQGRVFNIGEVFNLECGLGLFHAALRQRCGFGFFVHYVVRVDVHILFLFAVQTGEHFALQTGNKFLCQTIHIRGFIALTGNNQRGTGLINQNGVHLVHDGKGMTPLHHLAFVNRHIVPQIVKAHLVIGTVGNIRSISGFPVAGLHIVDNQTHAQTQEPIDLAHPFRVTFGQIIVHGNDMHTLAGQCVQICRKHSHQRFTFTGAHLRNSALMQHNAADNLHPIGLHTQNTPCSLTGRCKCLRQNIVQSFSVCQPFFELAGFCLQLFIGQLSVCFIQRHNFIGDGVNSFQFTVAVRTE